MRVLKASALQRHRTKGIAIAGFDTIRVLGKGSFGVVRLVTERQSQPVPAQAADQFDGIKDGPQTPEPDFSCTDGTARRNLPAGRPLHDVFAMKVIRKSDMLRACQEGHLRAERDLLVAAEGSRWVVPLIASFQDNTNLYLVMEYMIGGDFLGLLLREDVLEESVAKYYVAEMILSIEEAHKMKWIHRDIKPDNFLISASGHLKISDFGLAFNGHWAHSQNYYNHHRETLLEKLGIKVLGDEQDVFDDEDMEEERRRFPQNFVHPRPTSEESARREGLLNWRDRQERRKLARSVVGTSQYMAPEVVHGQPYDGRCDWWSIGIILYECIYGRTPFYCENRHKTKESIVNHRTTLQFPEIERWARPCSQSRRQLPAPSDDVVDLLQGMLNDKELRLSSRQYRYAENRLGRRFSSASTTSPLARHVFANDAEEIKSHKFFRDVPWSQLHLTQPPFVPRVKENQSITKYFEEEKDIVDDNTSSDEEERLLGALAASPAPESTPSLSGQGQRAREKYEIGIEHCSDGELSRIKEHFGEEYANWKAHRMIEVASDRAARGLEPQYEAPRQPERKEKKRARDRLLRDPELGRMVLELRKKGAFFGYTYRRPKMVSLESIMRVGNSGWDVRRRNAVSTPTVLPAWGIESGEKEEMED